MLDERYELQSEREEAEEEELAKRKLENLGRKELESPVAEAIRKCNLDKRCGECKHYMEENEDGTKCYWCIDGGDRRMPDDEACDDWVYWND